jgi:predicted ATP-dependent endonuclease of OLD family
MIIEKICVVNFRKISKLVEMDLNYETLIVGKNNTAKTSIFEVVNKFLTKGGSFRFEDFNYSLVTKKNLMSIYNRYQEALEEQKADIINEFPFIELDIHINIDSTANLARIRDLIYEFDNNQHIIIKCIYSLSNINKLISDFEKYNEKLDKEKLLTFYEFFKRNFKNYFSKKYYSTKNETEYLNELSDSFIYSLFNIHTISAQRDVDDTSDKEKLTLSNAIWKFYEKKMKQESLDIDNEDIFKEAISDIKDELNRNYNSYFETLVSNLNSKVVNDDKQRKVEIVSDFDIENILKKNSKVRYSIDGELSVSESYNGLGYSNLLYIFIQIEAYKYELLSNDAPFNILFVEEPESHLHPQMQSVFLKKISDALPDTEDVYKIITTHSSYILQSANIESIRYFLNDDNNLEIKSLSTFIKNNNYSNLKEIIQKYFTINTCDMFFADKVILIEGTAERILMPTFFKILDNESDNKICTQHITIFEVGGTYAYIFQDLLRFLSIKNLTITDIDSVTGRYNNSVVCDISGEPIKNTKKTPFLIKTINGNITNWFVPKKTPLFIKNIVENYISLEERLKKNIISESGNKEYTTNLNSLITFQLPLHGEKKWGRTLEEQLIIENSQWIKENLPNLKSLQSAIKSAKNSDGKKLHLTYENITKEQLEQYHYEIVKEIEKSDFSIELSTMSGWKIPTYIKEGLEWLKN